MSEATKMENPSIFQQQPRRIAHLDMDAFFASVELLRYPQLKNKAVIIGGGHHKILAALAEIKKQNPTQIWDEAAMAQARKNIPINSFARLKEYVGRGVITTATYAAREFGVGSAMPMMRAAKLCPDAIMLPVDFAEYKKASNAFKKIILELAPRIEGRGIDEVYIDFSDLMDGQHEGGRGLAQLLQKTIFERTGLTCSIGVAPNKLLAKMASEFNKPNGISIVFDHEMESRFWPLPVKKINGVGIKLNQKLEHLGITTIGDLAAQPLSLLKLHFGPKTSSWLYRVSRGIDYDQVITHSEPISISKEETFVRDLHPVFDRNALNAHFSNLCQSIWSELTQSKALTQTIGIKVRYKGFKTVTREKTLDAPTSDFNVIKNTAAANLRKLQPNQPIRLLGIRLGKLKTQALNTEQLLT